MEVVCPDCHKVMHAGLWVAVKRTMRLYKKSKYSQNDIVRITRDMRTQDKNDEEIIKFLGLEGPMPWKQDLVYLKSLYAFNTTAPPRESPKPLLTEEEQRDAVRKRDKW